MDPRKDWFRHTSLGVELVVFFAAPLAGGIWLDKRIGTMPAFTLIGAALGFAAGIYRIVRLASEPHGQDARDTHGRDAHVTHGRDGRDMESRRQDGQENDDNAGRNGK